jgi:hypothetical protein
VLSRFPVSKARQGECPGLFHNQEEEAQKSKVGEFRILGRVSVSFFQIIMRAEINSINIIDSKLLRPPPQIGF